MPLFRSPNGQNGCESRENPINMRDLTLIRPRGWPRRPPIGGLTSSYAYLRPRRPHPPNP